MQEFPEHQLRISVHHGGVDQVAAERFGPRQRTQRILAIDRTVRLAADGPGTEPNSDTFSPVAPKAPIRHGTDERDGRQEALAGSAAAGS